MANNTVSNDEILNKVKTALGVTGEYQNDTLNVYIDEVKSFMQFAGISKDVVNSSVAVGVICRGVADLWNYGNGTASFSEHFKMRVTQLVLSEV